MTGPVLSVVVDSNVLFSALLRKESRFADILLQSEHSFYICESVIVELFRHKEKILRLSRLDDSELAHLFHFLLRRLSLYKEDSIAPDHWRRAHRLCRDVDETDTPHVALALQVGGLRWTGDKNLRAALQARGFTSFFLPEQQV